MEDGGGSPSSTRNGLQRVELKGNERLALRVAMMLILMQSVPSGLRSELVAARQLDVANILFEIFKVGWQSNVRCHLSLQVHAGTTQAGKAKVRCVPKGTSQRS